MDKKEIIAGRGFYYMPAAYITLKVTVEGIYDHEKMQQAVAALEEAHPIISRVVRKEGDRMWFEEAGKHVPVILYPETTLVRWEDALLELTTKPINLQENPGVMIGIAERTDRFFLLVICHHMYGDGLSVKNLADDLLYIYSTGTKLVPRESSTELCEADLSHNCRIPEELREKYLAFAETCKKKQIEFSWEAYKQMIDTHNAVVGTGVTCRSIKGTVYRSLLGKCKRYCVTVNSALTTAMAAAMQEKDSVDAIIAVNTRPIVNPEDNMGLANYASCIQPTISYDPTISFWDNVVKVNRQIKEARADAPKVLNTLHTFMLWGADVYGVGYFARYGMFRDMEVLMELRRTLGLNNEADTFDLSNIGSVQFAANSEDFVVRDCYFVPNPMPACACTFGASTLGNTISISLVYKKNHVSDEKAKELTHKVVTYLARSV